jgi:hypothetical protein
MLFVMAAGKKDYGARFHSTAPFRMERQGFEPEFPFCLSAASAANEYIPSCPRRIRFLASVSILRARTHRKGPLADAGCQGGLTRDELSTSKSPIERDTEAGCVEGADDGCAGACRPIGTVADTVAGAGLEAIVSVGSKSAKWLNLQRKTNSANHSEMAGARL